MLLTTLHLPFDRAVADDAGVLVMVAFGVELTLHATSGEVVG